MTATPPLSARFPTAEFEGEVTQVLVQSDARENTRRIEEEKKREERRIRRTTEKDESDKHNADIASRWAGILEKSIPEELLKEIDAQKAHCEEVIASKDKVIKEYRHEIKKKEDEYQKLLLKQGEEVDLFIEKMRRQFSEAMKHHEAQLATVENALNEERRGYLDSHQTEFNTLMERRQAMELRFMEWKQEAIEDDMRQIEQLMVMDAEEYNILKIKLETEIQTLEQQMQEMRATYQLNNEKLEYNFRLLHERENDHAQQIQQQKKKINRLQDMLSTVRAKYTKTDKKYRQKNIELTEEYKRMTEQYKDLQTKLSHFQEYDTQKYNEVWNLSMDRMQESVQQVLKADKVIHEQLLYLLWYPPKADIFAPPAVNKRSTSRTPSAKTRGHTSESTRSIAAHPQSHANNAPLPPSFSALIHPSASPTQRSHTSQSTRSNAGVKPPRYLGEVLALIRQEASFLTKSGIKPDSVADMDAAILRALGIETDEDVVKLVEFFLVDGGIGLIGSDKVLDALTAFVKSREEEKEKAEEDTDSLNNTKKRENEREKERERDGTLTRVGTAATSSENGGMTDDAVKDYWDRIAGVIPDNVVRIWDRLEQEMTKYNQTLKDRVNLLQGNESLKAQNDELKRLLNQYLSAKINEELIVPPVSLPQNQRRAVQTGSSRNSSAQSRR